MVAPLEGIVVVEVANYVAAPSAGALMRDLGAEVIKVEPPGGEVMRGVVPTGGDGGMPFNFLFELENRGKKSISLALDAPGAVDALHRLLAKADVFLTNLMAPRLEKFGLTPEAIHERNPHIIYAAVTGYGLEGPERARPGFDFSAFWTRSGIMGLVGHPDSPPVLSRIAQGDHTTGVTTLAGVLAALRLRDLTGEGQVVDISLQQVGLYTIATDVSRTLLDGTQPKRFNRRAPDNPLFNTYPTRDGKWIMLVHMTPDPYWPKLCQALGCEQWSADPAYATMAARRAKGAEIAAYIEERMLEADLADWAVRLDQAGLIWAPMVELPDVVADPQLRLRGAFQPLETERGTYETVGVPFVIREADVRTRGMASEAGVDTAAVLAWAGFSDEEMADLASGGALG